MKWAAIPDYRVDDWRAPGDLDVIRETQKELHRAAREES